jgi:cytochrome c biogenesis protein
MEPSTPAALRAEVITWLRWSWRSLTSMRTALLLLFLLALASVPGSTFPQRSVDPIAVRTYLENNPRSGPLLDRLGFFAVFTSPWFAAIYLLLVVSLIGCVLPRTREHAREMTAQPPIAPARLNRLPLHVHGDSERVDDLLVAACAHLRAKRWRVRRGDGWVSAEKGYLKETGNLLFHASLIVLILGVGLGNAYGFEGRVVIREGQGFSSTLAQFDEFSTGVLQDASALPAFSFTLDEFIAVFQRGGMQAGAPRDFEARITLRRDFGAEPEASTIRVNKPLDVSNASIYLVGHGYAPRFTVRDEDDEIVWSDSVTFLPQDGNFSSTGVIKIPDARPQLGIEGIFAPTAFIDETAGPISIFPDLDNPKAFLVAYVGDLGLDSGAPQNVYRLTTTNMTRIGIEQLAPGESWNLPGGEGTVTFDGVDRWASFVISHDPGQNIALVASGLALLGLVLSLSVKRRRIFVRVTPSDHGEPASAAARTLVSIGGLARAEAVGLDDDMRELLEHLGATQPSDPRERVTA